MRRERRAPCRWCRNRRKPRPAVIHLWAQVTVCRQCALDKGGIVGRRQVALYDLGGDFSPANLKRLAAGVIMDANALFLPAGKLSEAEYRERQRSIVLEEREG